MKLFVSIAIFIFLSGCETRKEWTPTLFFEQSFNVIKDNSIKKNDVNWSRLKETVLDSIKHFNSDKDVYRAIKYTIYLINDGHSVFINPSDTNVFDTDTLSIPDITH